MKEQRKIEWNMAEKQQQQEEEDKETKEEDEAAAAVAMFYVFKLYKLMFVPMLKCMLHGIYLSLPHHSTCNQIAHITRFK